MSIWLNNEFAIEHANHATEPLESTKSAIDRLFANVPKDSSILEFGCNVGLNLEYLRIKGFTNLSGYDINKDILNLAVQKNPLVRFYFELPKEKFDIVFVCGVLIHIQPDKYGEIFSQILSLAQNQIIGIENFSDSCRMVKYHGMEYEMWFNDFADIWNKNYPVKPSDLFRYLYLTEWQAYRFKIADTIQSI